MRGSTPTHECPPERTVTPQSRSRASRTPATTSASRRRFEHRAREPGRAPPVEDRIDAGRLVVGAAPFDQAAVEHGADPTGRRARP